MAQFAEMRRVFRQHLAETEELFGPERRLALIGDVATFEALSGL